MRQAARHLANAAKDQAILEEFERHKSGWTNNDDEFSRLKLEKW
jgi:hypothetical protein